MGIRKYKPTTPGRHDASASDFVEITRSEPEKPLLRPLHKTGGRNSNDRVIARHRGGGYKRQYRVIDSRCHDKDDVPAVVVYIEYDSNRTVRVVLPHYADGGERYILVPAKLFQGGRIEAGVGADIKPGNNPPLRSTLLGIVVHAVELKPGGGVKIARFTGSSVQPVAKEGRFAQSHMPSGEIRNVEITRRVTVGEVGDAEQSNINWGKAGRMRWKGRRLHARDIVMSPVDHSYGGGEGRTSGGRHPVSPWGKPKGHTRRPNKDSDRLIVRRRKAGKNR